MKDQINNFEHTLIGVGSNINPAENIQTALDLLAREINITKMASVWQTPAVGSQGPDFLNTAILIKDPPNLDILKNEVLSRIEHSLGRVRTQDKNADRPIDLDVLIYRGKCLDNDLWEQANTFMIFSSLTSGAYLTLSRFLVADSSLPGGFRLYQVFYWILLAISLGLLIQLEKSQILESPNGS